ncbi:MAG TPA: proton-conducting transporter membrane subunit [Hyphomicrobium sp.]|uniref:hydrogen gas-evolving membrane-bound hydrogenase subunit E n=1 Tax=Hyphomicrobium sp. TaxID=82 RepID=UPI002CF49356|nr:hydrogen gas-evolving membrane-bound hydrogenase subunit E [Hyphomicrobium sp.]HRN89440.1 proton-conducting transporter membrane subunit [Hyphomicrobium sp.]
MRPMDILALVAASLLLAPLAAWLGGRSSPLVAAVPALLFAGFLAFLPDIRAGAAPSEVHSWIPSLGIDVSFRIDGLSLLFALLITGIGTLVFLYASAYLQGHERLPRFYVALTLFMGAMLGAVLADDLVLLVVFWELTSLTSFLLIGTTPESAEARRSAQQGLLVTVAGGLALLAAVILLGSGLGTYSISEILVRGDAVAALPAAPAIVVLLAIGAFAKSAQVPLHSWLPNAMVAPTPVSAFLHSATMVKLGVYLLARFNPVFEGYELWTLLLTGVGGATMIAGAVLALRETDLKRVLAYSTVVSLGTLVLLIGLPGETSALAFAAFLFGHALYKACLFLVAGIVDHETGTRDSTALGGLRHAMPVTAVAAGLGAMSMAGLPLFFGFVGKELIYETGLEGAALLALAVALVANAAMVVVAGVVAVRCFLGPRVETLAPAHDPGFRMLAGPVVLAVLGLVFGIAPWIAGDGLLTFAAQEISGRRADATLALWHGFTPALALSALTLLIGVAAFLRWDVLRGALSRIRQIDAWGPDRGYDALLLGLQRIAVWQTNAIQTGSLRVYVGRVLTIVAFAGAPALYLLGGFAFPLTDGGWLRPDLVLAAALIVAALAVVGARGFVAGIVAAGMVGFAVALLFLLNGAPDLAFTQFSVEAIAIVILLAIVGRLPFRQQDARTRPQRLRDGAIAVGLGVSATCVLLTVLAIPFDGRLSDYFRVASVPEAHGRNLVNVILVDFRALDTLGEISVLGLAAMAAAAVVAGVRRRMSEKRT